MIYRLKQALFICTLFYTYFLLFYFLIQQKLNNDFSAFYSAALAYLHHASPYQDLSVSFLNHPTPLAVNVTPPFFAFLMGPLTTFTYTNASLIWAISSLMFGILEWLICFHLNSTAHFFKKNVLNFILIYLATYACLMNTSFNQVAGFLFFFLMSGYYFFLKQNDYGCGLFWGLAVAIKLFPGLLFIFALTQKRYKIFWTMVAIFILTLSLPLLTRGSEIYLQFYTTLSGIIWYGNTWNASILGFLFRVFVDMNHPQHVLAIKIIYQFIFIVLLLWYINKLNKIKATPQYGFCLSLIMMLLLSPFGWMYYFALLLPALILIYQTLSQEASNKTIALWSTCLFLLNLPTDNIQSRYIPTLFSKISLSSIYFYGLVMVFYLFLYVIKVNPQPPLLAHSNNPNYRRPLEFILGFSVLVVFSTLSRYL